MKLKVVGWTYDCDMRFGDVDCDYAARAAIIADIREHGYLFTGEQHQEESLGVPVMNDGSKRSFSQRGWGDLMAEAYDEEEPNSYAKYSFMTMGYDTRMPTEDSAIDTVVGRVAKEVLDDKTYDHLFEWNYTTCFPHPELGDAGVYTLTDEEADSMGYFGVVRQLPPAVCRCLFPEDLSETFVLDAAACRLSAHSIDLKMQDAYQMIAAGDRVVVGDTTYLVEDVDQYKDVPEEVARTVMYRLNEGYEEALEQYLQADWMLKIKYEPQ